MNEAMEMLVFSQGNFPKMPGQPDQKRSPTRWWQWDWKRILFLSSWGLITFFFRAAAVKNFRGALVSLKKKKNHPETWGKWSNEKLAHPFFFSNGWLKPPGHQLTSWIPMVFPPGFPKVDELLTRFGNSNEVPFVPHRVLPGKSPKKTDGCCTSPFDRKIPWRCFFSNHEWTANV